MITKKYNKSKGNCKVTFTLNKEQVGEKRDVRVLSDFNDWSWINGVQLKSTKGKYSGSVELPAQAAHYQFRYLVDGSQWMNDPEAAAYQPNVHGTTNCIFEVEGIPAPAKKTAKKTVTKKAAPAKKTADDLKRIEGIGPKIAGLLNNAGIITFTDLSKASAKKLQTVLDEAGPRFRMAKPGTWKQQAKLAAAGKDAELKKLQGELKGGVKK